MKEITSYELAVLVYENYIDFDSLSEALNTANKSIENIICERHEFDIYWNKEYPNDKRKVLNIDKERQKFRDILKQIEEIEF